MNDLWTAARDRIRSCSLADLPDIARASGVPLATLVKIKYGTTRNPRVETALRLVEHFDRAAAQ